MLISLLHRPKLVVPRPVSTTISSPLNGQTLSLLLRTPSLAPNIGTDSHILETKVNTIENEIGFSAGNNFLSHTNMYSMIVFLSGQNR